MSQRTTREAGGRARAAGRYHHGSLREALLEEAFVQAASVGLDALTLRGLARRLNVSHPAAYRHFASKRALIDAVADEGFARLDEALATVDGEGSRARFEAMGRAYVAFAVGHPGVYRAMFRRETFTQAGELALPASAQAPFTRVGLAVVALLGEHGQTQLDPRVTTLAVWSMMHGLATLWIDGPMVVQTGAPDVDAIAEPIASMMTSLLVGADDA